MKITCAKKFDNLDSMIQDMEKALDDAQVNSATNIIESSKVMAATDAYSLGEFVVDGWEILESLGFTYIGENDELMACNNGEDLIVTDCRFAIGYYSNISMDEKSQFLDDMLEEDCFPDLPENYDYVDDTVYYSIEELLDDTVGDFGA